MNNSFDLKRSIYFISINRIYYFIYKFLLSKNFMTYEIMNLFLINHFY